MRNSMDTLQPEAERISFRFLIEHPAHGWQKLSARRRMSIHRGTEPIIELANLTIRIADAYVLMKGRKAVCLDSLKMGIWTFDDMGRVDQGEVMKRILEKFDAVSDPQKVVAESQIADDDMKAVLLCLGLQQACNES